MQEPIPDRELVYIFDTLCGWCWGFSPVMQKIHRFFEHQLPLTVLSGGMVTGERVGPLGPLAVHILGALERVEHLSGQSFGPEYRRQLAEDTRIHDSTPPALALSLARDLDPDRALDFAHAQQEMIFVGGRDPGHVETQKDLARLMGFDPKDFVKGLKEPRRQKAVSDEFHFVKKLGISGYPTLLLRQGNQWNVLSHGFSPFDEVKARVAEALAKS